jgi:GT2 family glycosyltransferase
MTVMAAVPTATVVVVSRDRWSLAPATLDRLLSRTDRRHPVVLVDGRAPRRVAAAFDRTVKSGRVQVVRRNRFLASNEARNLGADGARTEWVAFVENDTELSDGWLDTLLASGEALEAASVYPAYLEPGPYGPTVHGIGADLDVGGPAGARYLREQQHHSRRLWREVGAEVVAVKRVQSEPHALVIRRELLERMGGLDEGLLSWFDHTDLALHHERLGAAAWFVPEVTCVYLTPPPVSLTDLPSFLLRWSEDWYQRSLEHLCAVWGLDRHDREWNKHAVFRTTVRRSVLTRSRLVNAVIDRAAKPIERLVTRRWDTGRELQSTVARAREQHTAVRDVGLDLGAEHGIDRQ